MRKLVLALIAFYQRFPAIFPNRCVYIPRCSDYAKEAFLRHSFLKAGKISFFRILRCHPFSQGGFDPVNPVRERLPKATTSLKITGMSLTG